MRNHLIVLAVFAVAAFTQNILQLAPFYIDMYKAHPWYVPEAMKSLAQIMLVWIATRYILKCGWSGAWSELGIRGSISQGLRFALLASVPLYVVFAATHTLSNDLDPLKLGYLVIMSPLAEEVMFRAFAFGLLRKAGVNFWLAALVPAVLFGAGHIRADFGLSEAIPVFLITGVGSLFFSWVYEKWGYNIWAPFGVHLLMNLAWNLFAVGTSAYAGWLPTTMQVTTILVAIGLTMRRDRIAWLQ